MAVENVERELQNLQEQLLVLQEEHAKTRAGWLWLTRKTGFLLAVFGISIFFGVMKTHGPIDSNPVAITLLLMSLFMLAPGIWLMAWSLRPMAQRLMKVAPRY